MCQVCAEIWYRRIIVPYFLSRKRISGKSLISDKYLEMLEDVIMPDLTNYPIYENVSLIWQ